MKWRIQFGLSMQYTSGIINENGEIYLSGGKFYVIGKVPPSSPPFIRHKEHDERIEVIWYAPVDDGGDPVTEYRIYKGNASGELGYITSVDASVLSYNDTDVVSGVEYFYHVTAVNAQGESDPSEEVSGIPFTYPTPPRDLVVELGNNYIHLTWEEPEYDGGFQFVKYDIYRGNRSDNMDYLVTRDISKRYYNDTDVEVGKAYYYHVSVWTEIGESIPSNVAMATYRTIPSPPVNLSLTSGNAFVHLEWQAPLQDGGSPLIYYRVYRGSGETFSLLFELDPDFTDHTDTSVVNGVTYSYNVTAVTEVGESVPSNLVTATPMTFPSSPRDLSAESENDCINLSWLDPESTGGTRITYFNLYRSGGGVGNIVVQVSKADGNTYQDRNVSNGLLYTYSVSAMNDIGESEHSVPVKAMPRGFPTSPLNISVVYGPGFVHLTWEPPASDEGSPVIGYRIYRNYTPPIVLDADHAEYNDTDVVNGVTYSYTVSATNDVGESERTEIVWGFPYEITVEEDPPTPPRNVSIKIEDGVFILRWDSPEYDGGFGIVGYRVYRGLEEEGQFDVVASVDQVSWSDSNITCDTEYHYYITTYNGVYESEPSERVQAKLVWDVTDDNQDENDNLGIFIAVSVIVLVLAGIGLGFFLVYRKGMKEEEDTDEEGEYEPPSYDFDSLSDKGDQFTSEDDS